MPFKPPVPLGDFAPDAPRTTPGVIVEMNNLEATVKGLRVMNAFVPIQDATLIGHPIGAYTALLQDGTYETFAATTFQGSSTLFLYNPTDRVWDLASIGIVGATRWRFATFGNYVVAVNGKSQPRIYIPGPTDPLQTGGFFEPIATLPVAGGTGLPADFKASTVCVVPEGIFLIEAESDRWWYSLPGPTAWTPSIQNGIVRSGTPGFLGGMAGPVTAALPCRGGVAFYKQSSLFLGRSSGPPYFWQMDNVSQTVGCPWQEAIIDTGDVHLFVGPDDFYMFDGSSLSAIPNNVREWFFRRIQPLQSEFLGNNPYPHIIGRWDAMTGTAYWHYSVVADAEGTLSEWVAFNPKTGKWTQGSLNCSDVVVPFFPERAADGHVIQRQPAVFDMNFALALQNGDPAPAHFVTGEFGDGASFFQLNAVRPVFSEYPSDRAATCQGYTRNLFGYPYPDFGPLPIDSLGAKSWLSDDGSFDMIQTARSHQLRIDLTGSAEIMALAVDFDWAGAD